MKNILIIFILFSLTARSQNVGDKLSYLLQNKQQLDITMYRFTDDYLELVSINDSVTTICMVSFKPQRCFGVHYLYLNKDIQSEGLKIAINGAVCIGDKVWIRNNTLITETENTIILTDVRRAKRIFKHRKQKHLKSNVRSKESRGQD